ncbi:two-component regulator propeller domain-containing protein [Flavobacterium sp. UMI-01]|uniref:two-component regulator propeller domain-containing protein n=1 Tax=Flavobacterium sp. UMI-01 TaxID=1441053 RepID=UPI001C7DE823|nr:two-component regulator propeller domain-containing protein [Flavobacterium sp. UMI-01]GIZ09742.1 hybrid sensor histidine kinase/response regulator [Flavobacterium sp. UMI-01]
MKKFVTLFIVLHSLVVLHCQNIKFEHYNDEDGLSHNSVRHIVQDNNGFLWLGTFSGLNRFDGYQFKSYLSASIDKNGMFNDDITALKFDKNSNNLWIGTRKGLTVFNLDTQQFKTYLNEKGNPNSLPDQEIRSVYIDKFKRVWVGTKNAGLYFFYPNENRFAKINIKGFNYVKEIFEDSKGDIWIGSYASGGVAKIILDLKGGISDILTYTLTIPHSKATNPYLNFIYEDFKSDIFVGTREGLYKLDNGTNSFVNLYIKDAVVRDNLGPYFQSIARAPDGKYWVGTIGGLLVCNQLEDIQKGEFQWHYSVLSDNTSLVDNLISTLFFDTSGVLWIGTEDGLDKYDSFKNQFKINKDISRYIDNKAPRIRGFAKTYDQKIIVVTRHDGLFISKNNGFAPLHKNNNDLVSIYTEDGKTFYCGLWNGKILVYDYIRNASKVIDVGFKNIPVFAFVNYDAHRLLVGSYGQGAVLLDKRTGVPTTTVGKILPGYLINKVTKDKAGNVWFAADQGLVKYNVNSRKTKSYGQSSNSDYGLPHVNVSDVVVDAAGRVWAATRMGLAMYVPAKDNFQKITQPKEINNKWITDIVVDTRGDLWLNMNNNSIAKYKVKQKKANIYNVNSGNKLDVFSSSGFYNFNNSKIYLGGKNGVIFFSPHKINENKWSPKPMITAFKIQDIEILPGVTVNGQKILEEDINKNKSIVLNYNNRNFSIQFSTPSFTNERLNKFKYMLEGFDTNWIETDSDSRTVQYTNLFPKEYVFKIQSSNSDGIWSEVVSYRIKVLPTFWFTYTGMTIILILLGLLTYFIVKQIKYRIHLKRELLTEKIRRERDEKLNNEKLRFFTNISHELRTPLTLILGPVKQLLDQENSSSFEKSRVTLIYQNANRLLRLVNQILDFRRAETGELKLRVAKADVLVTTKEIFNSFIELAQSKNINYNLNVEEETLMCWIDLDKYSKILFNLLSNAMKFTNNFGTIDLYIGFKEGDDKTLVVEISDDGIGIPFESQEKIFTRFYQANNSKENTTGTGIGLSFVKALVEILRGEIRVESEPNVGSIFTVELPVSKRIFKPEEIDESTKVEPPKPIEYSSNILMTDQKELKQIIETNENKSTDIKLKILIIDDNTELRKYLVDFLSTFYKVYEAKNGKEGLEVCRKVKPVLCVVDVMMPVMDGFQFVEELKADENISHTAVVMLTALAENKNRIKGYKIGVDGYLVKPFDPALLKTRIDNIIKIQLDLKQRFLGEIESDVTSLAHSQIDIELISKIKQLIEDNISNPDLTSTFICNELAMSSSKLYRKIKQLTDLSTNEFIRTIRLKKSAILLKTKNYNVSEVALMVGFNDPLYFSRCFKNQFGYSPSKLIK